MTPEREAEARRIIHDAPTVGVAMKRLRDAGFVLLHQGDITVEKCNHPVTTYDGGYHYCTVCKHDSSVGPRSRIVTSWEAA